MTEPSKLGRLFMYSKDTEFSALENFITEALAQAINEDAGPFVAALARIHWPEGRVQEPPGSEVRASTQRYLPDGGFLDLVAQFKDPARSSPEWWFEAKVDSPLSAKQLDAYANSALARVVPAPVIQLTRSWTVLDYPWLPWHEVARAAIQSSTPSDRWADLARFLKEQHVADEGSLPIEDAEAGALEAVQSLFPKVRHALGTTHDVLWDRYPGFRGKLTWSAATGTTGRIAMLAASGKYFLERGGILANGSQVIWYGLVSAGGSAYWTVRCHPRAGESGDQLIKAAVRLGVDWERSTKRSAVLEKRTRVSDFRDPAAASAWMADAIGELEGAGVLNYLLGDSALLAEHEPLQAPVESE